MTSEADHFLLDTPRGCFPHTEWAIFPIFFSHSFAELRINRRRRCLLAQNEEWELNFSVALSEGLDMADTQAHVPTHTEKGEKERIQSITAKRAKDECVCVCMFRD